MKLHTVTGLVLGALALAPAIAAAQPSAAPPPTYGGQPGYYQQPAQTGPGGFFRRQNRLALGFGIGLGGMHADDEEIACPTCDYNPAAFAVDFHIGGVLNPRLALLFELQANGQTVASYDGGEATQTLVQGAAMGAVQYSILPQLWIKGGIGVAHLSFSYDDAYGNAGSDDLGDGGVVMAAAGYELLSSRAFAIDLQLRGIVGSYDSGYAGKISSGTVGVGFDWY